jgi:CRP/FNR family transcriptional regulator
MFCYFYLNMYTELKSFLTERGVALSDTDFSLITAAATVQIIRKKELLLKAGEICRFKIFIKSGFLRTYRIDEGGEEHILQFSGPLSWTTEGESYANVLPSAYYIEALEDSELLIWTRDNFDQLLCTIPALKSFSEQLIFSNLHASRNRLYQAISLRPEEKYNDFLNNHPDILQRVPLRMVASYLGLSLKTLTRVRQAQLQK